MRYHTKNHSKFLLRFHLIFVVKYRKRLLRDRLGEEVKKIFLDLQTESIRIDTMGIDQDHIHFLIDHDPKISVLQVVRRFKQMSTHRIWTLCDLRHHFWKERTFWSDGYFAYSVGDASTETVRRYIETQG